MLVGLTLPQFADEAGPVLEVAERAEHLGLDGVFCFDHLWPMGQPRRPALTVWPLLGAVCARTRSITVGTLVARIGLLPDDVLESALSTLDALSGERLIAGLGTGDHHSAPENLAFGVAYEPPAVRRRRLGEVAARVTARGIPVWIGGGAPPTLDVARAHHATVNLWSATPARVTALSADGVPVSWGGPLHGDAEEMARQLTDLSAAGATWVVVADPPSLEALAEAAESIDRS